MVFFFTMFCISGIILNHRLFFSDISINRKYLPSKYSYRNWNNGLLRGTLKVEDHKQHATVLIYGENGLWATSDGGESISDYNKGLPESIDKRAIRGLVQMPNQELFTVGQFNLFQKDSLGDPSWQEVKGIQLEDEERLTDITTKGEELVLLSRSHIYTSRPPYEQFSVHELAPPKNYSDRVSLFKTVWQIHSGEIFGLAGRLFVDGIALVLLFLCFSGLLFCFLPHYIKRWGKQKKAPKKLLQKTLKWHDLIGVKTIILTLFITLTGWALRPPLLFPLAKNSIPTPALTTLKSSNPWHNKLRMIRYNSQSDEWLISTSKGFYRTQDFASTPIYIESAPPVSVMGLNVWARDPQNVNHFLIGSFSGIFIWDYPNNRTLDYTSKKEVKQISHSPFGKRAISGYTGDFGKAMIVEYDKGTQELKQTEKLKYLPMPLWRVALEVHTGRIYTFLGNIGSLAFISIIGLIALWSIWTGWRVKSRKKKSQVKQKKIENKPF